MDLTARAMPHSQTADERFMRLAVEQARLGDLLPDAGEVGCVIVKDGEVVAAGHNEARLRSDPTAHAEIVTLRKLGTKWRAMDFSGCTLYVTLQPCSMCAAACVWAKISRIVYGAGRGDVHSMYFDAKHFNAAQLIADAYNEKISIEGGVLVEDCKQFYYQPSDSPPAEEQENRP